MTIPGSLPEAIQSPTFPLLLLVGLIAMVAFYFGRAANRAKLPSIIGFIVPRGNARQQGAAIQYE